jgi:spermidine synthase
MDLPSPADDELRPESTRPYAMKRPATYGGIFLVALATLMLEILLTRIVSVQAWYHLAFFIISLAMLGMTAGALAVFVIPSAFSATKIALRLAQSAFGFALAVPISLALVLDSKLVPVTDLASFFGLLGTGAVLAVPFVLAGLTLTLALTKAGLPPGISYGVDLCGAALGCILVIPILEKFDGPSAAVVSAGIAALAGVAFAEGAGRRRLAVGGVIFGALLFALAGFNASQTWPPLRPRWVKGSPEKVGSFDYIRWNTYSRVTAGPSVTSPPFYWGVGDRIPPAVRNRPVEQRHVVIDGLAATTMQRAASNRETTEILPWDATQFVHHIRPHGPAAVIGVGGGRDVVSAVRAGHESVLGLEINKAIVALHRDVMPEYSGLALLPGVSLVQDEARSYLARDKTRYSVINMPMIDTWAATGAGAFTLSENGLYTVDAWRVFLSRLAPRGIFTVSRWYIEDAAGEAIRLTALAMDTLFSLGITDPRRHIVIMRGGWVATMLVSPSPFSDGDLAAIDRESAALGISILLDPRRAPALPLMAAVTQQTSSDALQRWAKAQTLDFRPPTDERPFFFNLVRPRSWLAGTGVTSKRIAYGGNLQATRTLVYATVVSTVLAAFALLLPLAIRRGKLGHLAKGEIATSLLYFALIGFGFMFVELGLLSRLSVFLGHPTLALAVLLSSIILFAGLGSLLSGRLAIDRARAAMLFPLVPAALLLVLQPLMNFLMHAGDSATKPVRIAISILLIAPPALGLGFGFPVGLRLVNRLEKSRQSTRDSIGPWLWGVNGACGVTASGLALACSMAWGVSATLLAGAGCYALLTLPALRIQRAGTSDPRTQPEAVVCPPATP